MNKRRFYAGWFPEPQITRRRIADAPPFMRGLRLMFVSDGHLRPCVRPEKLDALIALTVAQRPDMLLLGGDYAETPADCARFFEALTQLTPPLGSFGVLGNNDLDSTAQLPQWMQKSGVQLLKNSSARIVLSGGALEIGGCDDHKYGAPDTRCLFSDDPDAYRILLSHFPIAPECACALQLSGHTHGGQLCLGRLTPYSIGFERKFGILAVRGEAQFGQTRLLLCNGIGVSRLPLRIGAPPEILLVEFA